MWVQRSFKTFTSQPPVSVTKIVLLRTVTIMLLLFTSLLMTMAILLRPWKSENLEGVKKYLEISIFHVCRVDYRKGVKCYPGEHEMEAPAWFMTFRWFLLISTLFGYLGVFISIIQLTRKEVISVFLAPAYLCLAAGCLSVTALLMLIGYWDFEHLDYSRLYRMGWKEDMETEDKTGWPNDMAWAACVLFFFNFILCVYVHFKDRTFMMAFKANMLRREAHKMFSA